MSAERTIRRCSDLAELALDRRTADNTQARKKWCDGLGLDATDVGGTAVAYFQTQLGGNLAEAIEPERAHVLALIDLFLYGLLLGRELGL